MDFIGNQTVQGPNDSFSANCSKEDLFILMNKFEQESHEHSSQNRARRAFVLLKHKLFYLLFK